MAKTNIIQFKTDKNIKYVLARGNLDEQAQKAVINGTELQLKADDCIKIKVVVENGYEVSNIECRDYSSVYKTAWQVTSYEETQGLLVLHKKSDKDRSDNAVIVFYTQKKQPHEKKQKSVLLSDFPFWSCIANGEHSVQIKQGERIVCDTTVVKEE